VLFSVTNCSKPLVVLLAEALCHVLWPGNARSRPFSDASLNDCDSLRKEPWTSSLKRDILGQRIERERSLWICLIGRGSQQAHDNCAHGCLVVICLNKFERKKAPSLHTYNRAQPQPQQSRTVQSYNGLDGGTVVSRGEFSVERKQNLPLALSD
jgi:hypothetical protein